MGYTMVEDPKEGDKPMERYCCLYWMSKRAGVSPKEFMAHAEDYPEIWKEMAHYLSLSLVNLHYIFQNDTFIFAGPMVLKKDCFFPELLKEMKRLSLRDDFSACKFVFQDKEDVALGASVIAREKVLWSFLEEGKRKEDHSLLPLNQGHPEQEKVEDHTL